MRLFLEKSYSGLINEENVYKANIDTNSFKKKIMVWEEQGEKNGKIVKNSC